MEMRTQRELSDRLTNAVLPIYFSIGLAFAFFFNTWDLAIGLGGGSLLTYYFVKRFYPDSNRYQYVLSAVLGVFVMQFLVQSKDRVDILVFAVIGSFLLVSYQNWKLQIPMFLIITNGYFFVSKSQLSDLPHTYFADNLAFLNLGMYVVTIPLIFSVAGFFAYQLSRFYQTYIQNSIELRRLKLEVDRLYTYKVEAEDLSKQKAELTKMTKELVQTNYELEQFAYSASHDLQAPLRNISSFLKLLDDKYKPNLDEKGRQYIHFARDGAEKMKQITQDLLDFSKAGRKEDKREDIDLQQLVSGITSIYKEQIIGPRAIIVHKNLPTIRGFKAPIRQIFQNLIDNAIKYQKPDEIPLVIITVKEFSGHWQFSVIDNGIGIGAEDMDDIFLLFKRLHSNATYPGTGMGLSITKKIVEFLGGEIWVVSEKGKGSTFHFTLMKS